jgi:polar amino acid transport system substrate-binding protein
MKQFLIIYFLLTSLLYAEPVELTKGEKDWIKKHPVVKVSNELDWAPFDFYKNGNPSGYSIDIIRKLFKTLGLKAEFVQGSTWSELLERFERKEIDLMHVMSKTEMRAKKFIYSNPYMDQTYSFMIQTKNTTIKSEIDLDGKRIAAGKDWHIVDILKKNYPNAQIIEYPNSATMVEALSLGNVDALIDNALTAHYIMSERFITNIKHGGYLDIDEKSTEHYYFVTNKENPELISILNKAYDALSIEEKLKLQKKWFFKEKKKLIELSDAERAYLKTKKTIKACIDPNWMPFEKFDHNGKHIGMTAEYFNIFRNKIGIPLEVVKTNTWAESINVAKSRGCDIYSLAMATPERQEYMDFTSPYLSIPLVLATKIDVPFIDNIKYLNKEKVGVVKGYAFNELIRQKYPNIEVVDVKDIDEGLQKVVNGELFGFIGTLASIGYVFQKNFIGELKITGKFDDRWELGIGTRNDEPLLHSIFEKAINSLSPQKHQDILNRYISIKYEKGRDYDLIIKILIFVSILAMIGIYFYRRLSLANKKLRELQKRLLEQANRDPLTNLYNRRYLYDIASDLLTIAKRENTHIGIIILDIDNFKQINDKFGHPAGDKVIKTLSNILNSHTRESDIIARFGGEEFVVLLPNTNMEGSYNIASKLRSIVESEKVDIDSNIEISFNISLGVDNTKVTDRSIDESLNRADKALYKAKENGKNQVCMFNEGLSI